MRFLISVIGSLGFLPQMARAAQLEDIGSGPGIGAMWSTIAGVFPHTGVGNGVALLTGRIIDIVLLIIGAAAVAAFIYAGIQLTITGGDEGKRDEARKIAMYAALGIALASLGHAIVAYVAGIVSAGAGG